MESSGEEEEASLSSNKTLDSNGETSSSSLLTAAAAASEEEEEELTADSSVLSTTTSDALSNHESSNEEELFVPTFTRAEFVATYVRQSFSLPDPIMEYIAKNPSSPELYQKLIQTCKYFFLKNPILVVPKLEFVYTADGWYAKFNGKRILLNDISSKFWVTGAISKIAISNLYQNGHDQNILSNVTQKIFRCDNNFFNINQQNIFINDLILLASKSMCIYIHTNTVVENDGGSVVPCEKVFASLPLVKHFGYNCTDKEMLPQIFTSKTVEELCEIPHFATLQNLQLHVPHDFDLVRLNQFFKENNNETGIQLFFCDPIYGCFCSHNVLLVMLEYYARNNII